MRREMLVRKFGSAAGGAADAAVVSGGTADAAAVSGGSTFSVLSADGATVIGTGTVTATADAAAGIRMLWVLLLRVVRRLWVLLLVLSQRGGLLLDLKQRVLLSTHLVSALVSVSLLVLSV